MLSERFEGKLSVNQLIWDEIADFQDSNYVSAPETCWRIFRLPMSYRSHAIIRLTVHLPLEQFVFFEPGQEPRAVAIAVSRETTLTAWFKLHESDVEARQCGYRDIPPSGLDERKL